MELAQSRRGEYGDMRFIGPERVAITYAMPLAEVLYRAALYVSPTLDRYC